MQRNGYSQTNKMNASREGDREKRISDKSLAFEAKSDV